MEKKMTRQEQEELFLKIYNETGVQKTAYEAVGWLPSKASYFVKKIREKEPERLQVPQKPHSKPMQADKTTPNEEKAKERANTKPQKGTMGFRADLDKIEFWRMYADVTDRELGAMCTVAIDEYIERHELTADQKEIINIRLKALEAEKQVRERNKK